MKKKKTVSIGGLNFKEPAMNYWVSAQAMNEVSRDLRENYQSSETTKFFLLSIALGITATYFLSVRNWVVVFILLFLLVLSAIPRLNYLNRRRKELLKVQDRIRNHCESIGIKMPGNKE